MCNLFRKNSADNRKGPKNIGEAMTTELLTDPGHTRADLAKVRRAIREGWDIPEQLLSALPKIAGAMAVNPKEKAAVRLKAIATIIKMKEQNDKPEPSTTPQPQTTRSRSATCSK